MKSRIINILWGILLIIGSGLLLADVLGYISFGPLSTRGRAIAFWVASAAFFLTYFLNGVRKWGWLFPALICAVMGWSSLRTGRALDLINLDWLMLAAIAVPFYVGFAIDRRRWGLLIPAYILSVAAFINFSNEMIVDITWAASPNRIFLSALFSSAVPLFAIALPFYVLYFRSKESWWALIPAGALTSIGLVNVLSILIPNEQQAMTGVYNATMLLGFAVTMGVLWLRRATQPTDWAKYPAAGLLVLAVAALFLGKGWVDLSQDFKSIFFVVGSAIFFLAYFLHGEGKWGWLFPALGCAAMALTIWMEDIGMYGSITAVPLFASAALPFFVGFAVDRKHRWLLIPATFLTAFTIFLLIADVAQEDWAGVAFFFLGALPFFFIYFWSKHNWWALIPAGGFVSFGLVVLLETLIPHQDYPSLPNQLSLGVYIWVLFLGLAATFGAVWLHHKTEPTEWAKYPTAGLLVVGVLALLLGEHFQDVWLVILTLVVGVIFLLTALNKGKSAVDQHRPVTKA